MEKEKKFILGCLSLWVRNQPAGDFVKDQISALDLERMLTNAREQKVLPFLGVFLKDHGMMDFLPSGVKDRLLGGMQGAEWQNVIKRMEFGKVNRVFAREHVPVIPLKGIALTHLVYKERPVRVMGDIDLLVREEDLEKVGDLLRAEGFELEAFTNRWQDEINKRLIGRWSYVKGRPRSMFSIAPFGAASPPPTRGLQPRSGTAPDTPGNPRAAGSETSRFAAVLPSQRMGTGTSSAVEEGLAIDIQWRPRFLVGGQLTEWNSKRAWRGASPFPSLGANVWMLSPLDLAHYLVFQMANDFEKNVPSLLQFLDLALVMRKNHLTRDQVLAKDSLSLAPASKMRLEKILTAVRECFFETRKFSDFSDGTQEALEFFFEARSHPSPPLGARSFLRMTRSPKERIIFFAGYFFPSKGYLRKTYGSGFFAFVGGYFKHLSRLLFKVLSAVFS